MSGHIMKLSNTVVFLVVCMAMCTLTQAGKYVCMYGALSPGMSSCDQ